MDGSQEADAEDDPAAAEDKEAENRAAVRIGQARAFDESDRCGRMRCDGLYLYVCARASAAEVVRGVDLYTREVEVAKVGTRGAVAETADTAVHGDEAENMGGLVCCAIGHLGSVGGIGAYE